MVDLRKIIAKFGLNKKRALPLLRQKQIIAQNLFNRAVYAGKIKRPTICHNCLIECKPVAHHPDYNRPTLVWWLCYSCHFDLHQNFW